MKPNETEKIYRDVVFIIDVSSEMNDDSIAIIEKSIEEIVLVLKEAEDDFNEFRLSTLIFSEDAEWLIPIQSQLSSEQFMLPRNSGKSRIDQAYQKLNTGLKRRSKGGILPEEDSYLPLLILFTKTKMRSNEVAASLDLLSKNGRFIHAVKLAYCFPSTDDNLYELLKNFTGNPDYVIKHSFLPYLRRMVQRIE